MTEHFTYRHRSPSQERPHVNNISGTTSSSNSDHYENESDSDDFSDVSPGCQFMFMSVKISHVKVQALLDSGCDINVVSE